MDFVVYDALWELVNTRVIMAAALCVKRMMLLV